MFFSLIRRRFLALLFGPQKIIFLFTKYPPHFPYYNKLDKIPSEYDVFALFFKSPEIIIVGQNVETGET